MAVIAFKSAVACVIPFSMAVTNKVKLGSATRSFICPSRCCKLVKSGHKELAKELEEKGYSWIEEELANTL